MFLYYFILFSYSYINHRYFTFKGWCCALPTLVFYRTKGCLRYARTAEGGTNVIFSFWDKIPFLFEEKSDSPNPTASPLRSPSLRGGTEGAEPGSAYETNNTSSFPSNSLQVGGKDPNTTSLRERSEDLAEAGNPYSRVKEKEVDNNQGNGSPLKGGGTEPENNQSNDSKNKPENNKGKSRDDFNQDNGSETERQVDQGVSSETENSPNLWEGSDAAEDMDDKYYQTLKDKHLWGDFNYNSETDQCEAAEETPVASSSKIKSPESEQEPEYDADVEDFEPTYLPTESDSEYKNEQKPDKVSEPSQPQPANGTLPSSNHSELAAEPSATHRAVPYEPNGREVDGGAETKVGYDSTATHTNVGKDTPAYGINSSLPYGLGGEDKTPSSESPEPKSNNPDNETPAFGTDQEDANQKSLQANSNDLVDLDDFL